MRIVLAIAFGILVPIGAQAQQHWCERGNVNNFPDVEKVICTHGALVNLDKRMEKLYFSTLDDANTRAEKRRLEKERRAWLAFRDSCETDPICLNKRYRLRNLELSGDNISNPRPRGNSNETVTITREGYFKKVHSDGRISYYDPETDRKGSRDATGEIKWIGSMPHLGVNPADLPILPGHDRNTIYFLANDILATSSKILTPRQMERVSERKHRNFVKFVRYYVNAIDYFYEFNHKD